MNYWMTWIGCITFAVLPATAQTTKVQNGDKDEAQGVAQDAPGDFQNNDGSRRVTINETLERGDGLINETAGHYVDTFTLDAVAGQTMTLDMTSQTLDTLIYAAAPSGETWANDDFNGTASHSRVSFVVPESGEYSINATSYGVETGTYRVVIELSAAPNQANPPNPGAQGRTGRTGGPAQAATQGGAQNNANAQANPQDAPGDFQNNDGSRRVTINETLERGDAQLGETAGHYYDYFTLDAVVGQTITVDMTSDTMDTLLAVESPGVTTWSNDDFNGTLGHSHVSFTVPEDGEYRVRATSFGPQTGNYRVVIQTGPYPAAAEQNVPGDFQNNDGSRRVTINDSLQDGDREMSVKGGYYFDFYTLDAVVGQTITIDMTSDTMDTLLGVESPGVTTWSNDDFNGTLGHSRVSFTAPDDGEYRIRATSFGPQTGNYRVVIQTGPYPAAAEQNAPAPDRRQKSD